METVENRYQVKVYKVDFLGNQDVSLDAAILDCLLTFERRSPASYIFRWVNCAPREHRAGHLTEPHASEGMGATAQRRELAIIAGSSSRSRWPCCRTCCRT